MYSLSVVHHQLPEPGPWQHFRSPPPLRLRAVPARVSVVPGGFTGGTGVVPEDGTGDFALVGFQLVRPVHPRSLPVLPAEAAVVGGTTAGVRQAAGRARLCGGSEVLVASGGRGRDVAPRCRRHLLWPQLEVSALPVAPDAQPLQEPGQVHVVVPHVEGVLVGEEGAARDPDFSPQRCHIWSSRSLRVCASNRPIYRQMPLTCNIDG